MIRDNKLDILKFFLIFCVVFGHCLGHYLKQINVVGVYNFVYFFHMPLFVFLSGYFTKKSSLRCKKFWVGEFRLFETYLIFDFFHRLSSILDGTFVIRDLIEPSWSLWYLISLIYWRFLIQVMSSLFSNWKHMLAIAFLLSLTSGFVTIAYGLSFQRTFSFLPFFVIGYIVSQNNLIDRIRAVNHFLPAAICLVFLIVCILFVDVDIHTIVWGAFPYCESGYAVQVAFLYRVCYYLIGLLLTFSIINVFNFNNSFFAIEGRKTIIYYVYHTLLLLGAFALIEYFQIPVNFIMIALVSLVVMAIIYVMGKFRFFVLLLNPISSVLKNLI